MRPTGHLPVAADELPRVASVVGAKEPAAVGRLAIRRRHAVARLHLGVDAVRHRLADAEPDLADRLRRQATGELLPCRTAVGRLPDAAPRASAGAPPRMNLDLPETRVENARVRRVHHDITRASGIVDEKHSIPRFTTVARTKDAALSLGTICKTQRGSVNEVGVVWRNNNARDASRILESRARPRLAGVRRPEHPPAGGDVAPRERLPRPRIDDVYVARRHRDRAD